MGRKAEFKKSPLAPNVPLDGTDTVVGLRQLERQQLAQASPFRTLGPERLFVSNPRRRNYERYKGPYLEDTNLDALRAVPRTWLQFFGHVPGSALSLSYNIPEHVRMLCERLDENLVYYLSNYVRMAGAVLLLVLHYRPSAVIGLAVLAANLYFNLVFVPSLPPAQQADSSIGTARTFMIVAVWIAGFMTQMASALLRWAFWTAVLTLLHASCRRSVSEYLAAARNHHIPLGVPFSQVFSFRPRLRIVQTTLVDTVTGEQAVVRSVQPADGGPLRGQSGVSAPVGGAAGTIGRPAGAPQHDDPRRVFRELGSGAQQLASAVLLQVSQLMQHYWLQTRDSLQYRERWRLRRNPVRFRAVQPHLAQPAPL